MARVSNVVATNFKKMDSFQMLRGVCAILVIFSHIRSTNFFSGTLGVVFFMLMSGFFCMYSTENNKKNYLTKKLIKIIPLYYVLTLLVFLISSIKPELFNYTEPTVKNLIRSLLFVPYNTSGIGHRPLLDVGWYLNVEVMFCIIFSFFNNFCYKKRGFYTALTLFVMFVINTLFNNKIFLLDVYFSSYILCYIFGIFSYFLYKKFKIKNEKNNLLIFLLIVLIFFYACFFKLNILNILITFIIFMFFVIFNKSNSSRIFIGIGNISFSIYLIHEFIVKGFSRLIYSLDKLNLLTLLFIFLCLLMIYVVSFCVNILFEKIIYNYISKRLIKN